MQHVFRTITAFLFLGLAMTAVGHATQPVGLADFFAVREASSPKISPDGTQVAYVLATPDLGTDTDHISVRLVNVRTREDVALSPEGQRSWQPAWAPSGDRLAFVRANNGRFQIMVANSQSRSTEMITELAYPPTDLTWSPDGSKFAFFMSLPVSGRKSLVADPPSGASWAKPATVISAGGFQSVGAMLPTQTEVFLYVIDSKSGAVATQVTTQPVGRALPYTGAGIAWSQDGKRVIAGLSLAPDSWRDLMASELYSIDVSTGALRKIAGGRAGSHHPVRGPDGRLAFQCQERTKGTYFDRRLCAGLSEDGPFTFVSGEIDRPIVNAVWSPDGRGLVGVYLDEAIGKLTYFGLDGRREVLAVTGGGDVSSYTSGGSISIARDGTVAFSFSDQSSPSEIAIVRRGDKPHIITRVNADYLSRRTVNPVEAIRYRASDNKVAVHGWVVKPANFVVGQRYPTIVLLHGGQSSDFGPDFDLTPQIFAAHGYVVLMPNYRGSGSYGAAFGDRTDYPMGIDADVLGGVDALIANGIADPKRLFIVGGSGGGLSTGWTIGHSTRFNAAVMWYPPTEFASYVLDAATGPTTMRGTFADQPWNTPDDYFSRSPLSHVGKITTPTKLIVGADDRITPVSQSVMFFTALQERGVPSELLVYPAEVHGIREHPSHSASVVAETLAWFAKYGSGQAVELPDFSTIASIGSMSPGEKSAH